MRSQNVFLLARSIARYVAKPAAAAVLLVGAYATSPKDVEASCLCYYGGPYSVGATLCMPGNVLKWCETNPAGDCWWGTVGSCTF